MLSFEKTEKPVIIQYAQILFKILIFSFVIRLNFCYQEPMMPPKFFHSHNILKKNQIGGKAQYLLSEQKIQMQEGNFCELYILKSRSELKNIQFQHISKNISDMKLLQPNLISLFLIVMTAFINAQLFETSDDFSTTLVNKFQLQNQIPSTMTQNEVIRVTGAITNVLFYTGKEASTFIFEINFTLKNDKNVNFSCWDIYPIKNLKFDMSCALKKAGQFYVSLSAAPSNMYESRLRSYQKKYTLEYGVARTIKPFTSFSVPSSASKDPPKPEGFEFSFVDNNLELKWTSKAPLTNVTFYQISSKTKQLVKKEFLLSGNHQIFYPDFFEFRFFYPGNTTVEISHANSEDGTLNKISSPYSKEKASVSFNAIRHLKQFNDKTGYSDQILPYVVTTIRWLNLWIYFHVKTHSMCYLCYFDDNTATRIRSDEIQLLHTGDRIYKPFNAIGVALPKPGSYLISFLSQTKQLIFNHPFYVQTGTPLLPDYFDFNEYFVQNNFESTHEIQEQFITRYLTDGQIYKDPGFNATIQQQRNYLLTLLNYERKKYSHPPLQIDDNLQQMAQEHSQDMLNNNYVDSKNKKGEMPIDRALRYKLTSNISQTIIVSSSSLGRLHLESQIVGSMIDSISTRVLTRLGIGIVINQTQNPPTYIITYDFTLRDFMVDPPNQAQIQVFTQKALKIIRDKNPNIRFINDQLTKDIKIWAKDNISDPKVEDLQSYLPQKWSRYRKPRVFINYFNYTDNQFEKVKVDQVLLNVEGTQMAIYLRANNKDGSKLTGFTVFCVL